MFSSYESLNNNLKVHIKLVQFSVYLIRLPIYNL